MPRIGPGAIVAAAFIGPGTVTSCTLAGVRFGYALLWALVFATLGTIALQEMSARLGTVARIGLGEALRARFGSTVTRWGAAALVAAAIVIGNAAYQTGNLLGAALGASVLAGGTVRVWVLVFAAAATILLWSGRYVVIERVLVALVVLMSVVFLATAVAVAPDLGDIVRGALVPRTPGGGAITALALVGTTIVPYNLFLHARAARERFTGPEALRLARADLTIAIGLGGIISMAIVVTAAAAGIDRVDSAAAMATQLEPLLGRWATAFFAAGLFAAGFTSAITAPLAAGIALAGAVGWRTDLDGRPVRFTLMFVMLAGAGFAASGIRPLPAIVFAQAANGLLLPIVAVFLLVVMNDRRLLGEHVNGPVANAVGAGVALLTAALGAFGVISALR